MIVSMLVTLMSTIGSVSLMVYVTRVSRRLGARSSAAQVPDKAWLPQRGKGVPLRLRENGQEWWWRDGVVSVEGPRRFSLTTVCPWCGADGLHHLGDRRPLRDAVGEHEEIDRGCLDCGKKWQERTETVEGAKPTPKAEPFADPPYTRPSDMHDLAVIVGDQRVALDCSHPVFDRIDTIARTPDGLRVIRGVPTTNPVPPVLAGDFSPVADVRVRTNSWMVRAADIVDRRRFFVT